MPNVNSPFGLIPLGIQNNTTPSFGLQRAVFPNTTGVCARGDGLRKQTTGFLEPVTGAVAATQWAGIAWGFEFLSIALGRRIVTQYYPGSGNATGDVEVLYVPLGSSWVAPRVRAQAAGTPFTRAMIGANMEIAYTAPSATLRGGSSQVAITAADATTAGLPWRLVDLWSSVSRDGGVDDTSNFNWGIFEFNTAGILGT
jgi:hypothetical protein